MRPATLDLFTATPSTIRNLMDQTDDPEVLRCLVKLEAAAEADNWLERGEAIGELSDLLVLERGLGWEGGDA